MSFIGVHIILYGRPNIDFEFRVITNMTLSRIAGLA